MKHTKLFLVLMLLVAFLTPSQGVYAESGSDSPETQPTYRNPCDTVKCPEGTHCVVMEKYPPKAVCQKYQIPDVEISDEVPLTDKGNPISGSVGAQPIMAKPLNPVRPDGAVITAQMAMPVTHVFQHIDPIHLIVGAMFQQAKDIRQEQFMQNCENPEEIVDAAIAALKEKGVWNDKSVCKRLEAEALECKERGEKCEYFMTAGARVEGSQGLAVGADAEMSASASSPGMWQETEEISCENLSEERIYKNCVERHTKFLKENEARLQTMCQERWMSEEHVRKAECSDDSGLVCDKDTFVANLEIRSCGHLKENAEEYDNCIATLKADAKWDMQEDLCDRQAENRESLCDKDAFMKRCLSNSGSGNAASRQAEVICKQQATHMYQSRLQFCQMREKQYDHCKENAAKHCAFFETAAEKCLAVTDEELRTSMIEQAQRMCKWKQYETGEALPPTAEGRHFGQFVKGVQAARAHVGLSEQAALDEQTEEVVDVAEKVKKVEEKGVGYKLKWFLGIAAKSEKEDAQLIKQQAERLDASIASLSGVASTLTDATAKAAIEAQIEVLKGQKEDLHELAKKKQKRAKGMFSFLFGGDESAEGEVEAEAQLETE